jgi:hypothetical protein
MAAVLAAVATGIIAPVVGLGSPFGARAAVERDAPIQTVNRTHKGNRLPVPAAAGKMQPSRPSPTIMIGCDPAFSPLSTFARANFAGRCIG